MQRYFINSAPQATITLPDDVAQHLLKVMRAQAGTQIEVVLDDHRVYLAELTENQHLKLLRQLPNNSELPVKATLICGIPKTKEKPEIIVQKATELGADRIIFFEAARSVSHWNGKKQARKLLRLQKIAQGAAEQSHRNYIPTIEYAGSLEEVIAANLAPVRLVAWEESAKQGETSALHHQFTQLQNSDEVAVVFGPEGGLTDQEVQLMEAHEFIPVGLGPRILRTETAPLYFMAALSYAVELASPVQ